MASAAFCLSSAAMGARAVAPTRAAASSSARRCVNNRATTAQKSSSQKKSSFRLAAISEPEAPAAPAVDPLEAFYAIQMPDTEAMLKESTFPIPPAELIALCKGVLATNNAANDPSRLSDNFNFVAPVVGPLPKTNFLEAFKSFKIEEGFPDARFNYYAFRVDPFEPNRVWYDARFVGTHTGTLVGTIQPTGIKVMAPPQSCSMLFNTAGECTQLTVGYVMDKNIGNTGGLGGIFGIFYAIGYGLPFPEARPWEKSLQYAVFQQAGAMGSQVQKLLAGFGVGN